MVKCKNVAVRDSARWKIHKEPKIFYDRLHRTKQRNIKRPIIEEKKIITTELNRYSKVKRKFQDYDLGWTAKGESSFFPTLVKEFYVNYQARLENMCKEGEKSPDQPLLDRVPVQGVMVDFSEMTINRFLHGLGFTPQSTSSTFYAWLKLHKIQQSWLANLIAQGKPKWLTNPNEWIFKDSLNHEAKFWLCKATHVLEVVGLDKEFLSKKTHNLIQYDKNQTRLILDGGAGIETDPLVTGISSAPNVAVHNLKVAAPTSSSIEDSMPTNETNPSVVVSTTEFALLH
ncbi:hypothetical protein CQW23_14056 [Capsicum baccatum]|uniref:Putative plant transposon protein domain-containing protein n=1 Tax=Capsicum baccatum TaxID=33114 RepID=A0A2G2WI27_CAPBA|nr:hypothetical protein CQW23_14056 [Capsicum baccatum]